MSNTMFFSLLLNIGLLVLIATMLTKIPVVRSMLLGENNLIGSRAALAVIFGLVSIVSTYTGVRAQGAIVNTRVIGVLAAGLLGGPYVGMGAAIIGGLHRYLFDNLRVLSNDCCSSHSLILASCPESKISGTFHPL